MYSKIVVGTDGSETAAEAVRQAADLARAFGAELIIVNGAKTAVASYSLQAGLPADVEGIRDAGEQILRGAAETIGPDVKVRTVMREGDPAEAILDQAEDDGADLIVVGNRGMRGAKRFVLGSVPNHVAHNASCNVLIVHTT
jgi:nucleotide-binding universal stress UspA family protein